jgi:hypothetical protein
LIGSKKYQLNSDLNKRFMRPEDLKRMGTDPISTYPYPKLEKICEISYHYTTR